MITVFWELLLCNRQNPVKMEVAGSAETVVYLNLILR